VRLTGDEERRAPVCAVVFGKLQVPTLSRHIANHVTDAAPRVEPRVQEAKFGLAGIEESKAERRIEQ